MSKVAKLAYFEVLHQNGLNLAKFRDFGPKVPFCGHLFGQKVSKMTLF